MMMMLMMMLMMILCCMTDNMGIENTRVSEWIQGTFQLPTQNIPSMLKQMPKMKYFAIVRLSIIDPGPPK
jgi:hypothetical protein